MSAGARRIARVGAAAAMLALTACVDTFLEPEPGDDPVSLFDQVWTEFDRHYAFFGLKGIDWDGVRATYRPRVTAATTSAELFTILGAMLDTLRDGHVNLWTPLGTHTWTGWYEGRPANFDANDAFRALQGGVRWTASRRIAWGRLTDDVGYVYVPQFAPGSWAGEIDDALRALDGTRALVLDVRDNGGGTDRTSEPLLARFTDRDRVYRYYRYRDGPGHDDFTDLIEDRIQPAGHRFDGPVALLTNRRTYSTAEDFVLGMTALADVTLVGDTTGGGTGNPTHRELPNGWTFSVSRWQVFDADRRPAPEGIGIAPDLSVRITPADEEAGRDAILLAALALLEGRIGAAPRPARARAARGP